MHRKLICTIASVAMLAGLLFIGATPAQAAPPTDTQNFAPDDTPDGSVDGTFLSDKNDGTDQLAHLTNVSTQDTSEVRWFACPEARFTGTGQEVTANAELNGCTALGTDSTPTSPEDGPGTPPVPDSDEAYELFFDIPAALDDDLVDIVAAACTNAAAPDFEDDPPMGGADDERNCSSDVEDQVLLDDASAGIQGAQTSAGEITGLCSVDTASSADCELEDGADPGTVPDPDPAVDARFAPLPHGSNVPNDRFTIRATSSIDVTQLNAYLVDPADAANDPSGSYTEVGCDELTSTATSRTWQCTFTNVNDNAEQQLAIFDDTTQPGTGGNCTDPAVLCKLDAHYVVSQDRRADSAVLTFENPDLTAEENCAAPSGTAANDLGDSDSVLFCVADQFGAPISTDVTFESTGVASAGFNSSADCTAVSHDGDAAGVDEHCDGSTAGDGIAQAIITNPDNWSVGEAATPGDQIVTACIEGELAPGADHGCANETITDSVTKTWDSVADSLVLVIGDKTTDCFTGPTFAQMEDNDTINVLACVFDDFGNPTSTTGDDDGFLEWSIDSGADDDVDTQYESAPAETDAEGEAVAVVEGISLGTDFPTVCLRQNGTGNFLSCDSVQLNVTEDTDPGKENSKVGITHRKGPHRFKGRVTSPDPTCEPGRTVVVKRRRPGADKSIGSDVTNAAGKYRVPHNKTGKKKTYYAKVNGNADCKFDLSKNIRRR